MIKVQQNTEGSIRQGMDRNDVAMVKPEPNCRIELPSRSCDLIDDRFGFDDSHTCNRFTKHHGGMQSQVATLSRKHFVKGSRSNRRLRACFERRIARLALSFAASYARLTNGSKLSRNRPTNKAALCAPLLFGLAALFPELSISFVIHAGWRAAPLGRVGQKLTGTMKVSVSVGNEAPLPKCFGVSRFILRRLGSQEFFDQDKPTANLYRFPIEGRGPRMRPQMRV